MDDRSALVRDQWNEWSETWYKRYRTGEVIAGLIARPESAFHPATLALIKRALPDLRGKRVCVPSSGNNHAVFAFHLLGARVTSCDISGRQLDNSRAIALQHGWAIDFVQADTMRLDAVVDGAYDLVYTSNGVHVWISDLPAMYGSIRRVLKDGGACVMYDVHPFTRPFDYNADRKLRVVRPYDGTGPFGDVPRYTWRVQDIANAMSGAGLRIARIEETYAEDGSFWIDESRDDQAPLSPAELEALGDWRANPLAALPQWLSIYAVK
ncbi:Methyltransferase domain-containing protein [Paenibacillus sp. UNC496MF]|uniref:class I SAM-dependent methyltransferase n=1 Tax=Paenibacillus sp. UNC496MF TaxID=1502753 RepID=UPI0008E8789A|nr:class I SAM-dependent methyltransferase [Paenibacillus sp. UNC496MF]SFI48940.1 Methyltransferase domain-containing protein [Paenibacillus sp. UNC496MF]